MFAKKNKQGMKKILSSPFHSDPVPVLHNIITALQQNMREKRQIKDLIGNDDDDDHDDDAGKMMMQGKSVICF